MVNIFSNLIKNISEDSILNASSWLNLKEEEISELQREQANKVPRVDTGKFIKENSLKSVSRILLGHLYLYRYNPKFAKQLPYYDIFPIVFPIQKSKSGFLGLNMHYLPYQYRAFLMDSLYEFAIGNADLKRIKITYNLLSSITKLRFYRPCLKHYLNNNIKSRFIHVDPSEWNTAIFLPLQKFKKATVQQVHKDSIKLIKKRTFKRKRL